MKIIFMLLVCFCSLVGIQAQQYQPVDDKSAITFTIKNFGISTGGSFKGLDGTIDFDKTNPGKAAFNISIDAGKVNTDNDSRDSHLRKEEYFDAGNFPKISFQSERITARGSGFSVSGKLTIKGTTKDISFPFSATAKEDGLLFEGNFEINRRDFKVGGNSMVLGDNVTVTLSVFARKKQ
jgi:polyisoprenoid-binding protein YceI